MKKSFLVHVLAPHRYGGMQTSHVDSAIEVAEILAYGRPWTAIVETLDGMMRFVEREEVSPDTGRGVHR